MDHDELTATNAAHARALGHPLRHRILATLGEDGATVSQLSRRLNTNKGNVAHHLGVLMDAGLARPAHTRTVRGGTEQYFVAIATRLRFAPGADGSATRASLAAMAEDVPNDGDHLFNWRRLRLSPHQARALSTYLDDLVSDLQPATGREPVYSVVVGVWPRRE